MRRSEIREPKTVDDAKQVMAQLAADFPAQQSAFMMTMLDELVDLACSGGKPRSLRGPIDDYFKLQFYKSVIARCAKMAYGQ